MLFGRIIERLWTEASWLKSTNQFADGQPLKQQFSQELAVIGILLDGMSRWEAKQMEQKQEPPAEFEYQQFGGVPNGP